MAATASSWKHLRAPRKREPLGFEALFTAAETERLKAGLVPQEMEEKWFIYFDAGWLRFHRSWTGAFIYAVRLEDSPAGARVVDSWVNRSPTQYTATDTAHDRRLLRWLIDALLLQKPDACFPSLSDVSPSNDDEHRLLVRPIQEDDFQAWLPLWAGYNAFYGRSGDTALPAAITDSTWRRFFDPAEPVFALVAEFEGRLLGLAHYLFHRSTTRIELTCYLQDLFTAADARGRGVGRALIDGVYEAARAQGIRRVYWQTHTTNAAGRALYDRVAQHAGFIVYSHDV